MKKEYEKPLLVSLNDTKVYDTTLGSGVCTSGPTVKVGRCECGGTPTSAGSRPCNPGQ